MLKISAVLGLTGMPLFLWRYLRRGGPGGLRSYRPWYLDVLTGLSVSFAAMSLGLFLMGQRQVTSIAQWWAVFGVALSIGVALCWSGLRLGRERGFRVWSELDFLDAQRESAARRWAEQAQRERERAHDEKLRKELVLDEIKQRALKARAEKARLPQKPGS